MKKSIFGLITTALFLNFLLTLNSCSKTDEPNQLDSKTLKLLSLDAKKLGEEHNNTLRKLANATTTQKKTKSASRIAYTEEQIYADLLASDIALEQNIKIDVYNYIDNNSDVDSNMISVSNSLTSQGAKELYLSINNQLDSSVDYSSIINVLDSNLEIVENSNYNEFDKQVFRIFIETSKASAYYWYIENEDTGNRNNKILARGTPTWVRKDGNGIAQASIGWAVVAAFSSGPAAPATYFLSCAVGGALASIWPD